jgi:hypothetical protein
MATKKEQRTAPIRGGSTRVEVFNSGLEVWIYDEANAGEIVTKGLWRKLVDGGKTDGKLVGYGLWQDDSLFIEVVVGAALKAKELSVTRWLEPQYALLRAPSGKLAIETNDSCRVADEAEDRMDRGGRLEVPVDTYRLTLHRIDSETLKREGKTWAGPQEVIVLTPGGKPKDDVAGVLPFKQNAELAWVGKVAIEGSKARGLVWFEDYWDTFFANLDSAAAAKLGLKPGAYLRVTVPATGHTFVTAFATNWVEGAKMKPPAGPKPAEFGYGAITKPQRWGNHEALFCRRVKTSKVVDEQHHTTWHEAIFEIVGPASATLEKKTEDDVLFRGRVLTYKRDVLAEKDYFDGDETALAIKLDARVKGVSFEDNLSLSDAVGKLDAAMSGLNLNAIGDFSFDVSSGSDSREFTVRAWGGVTDFFAAVWASVDSFEVFFYSRLASGDWLLTGTIDEGNAEGISATRPRLLVQGQDEVPLQDLLALHRTRLKSANEAVVPLPQTLAELVRLYDDYVIASLT